MHIRHILTVGFVLGSIALFVPLTAAPMAEAQEDAFRYYACNGNAWGCLAECGRQGVGCNPGATHPTRQGSLGWLVGCVVTGRRACAYQFPPGDKCFYPKDGGAPFCV